MNILVSILFPFPWLLLNDTEFCLIRVFSMSYKIYFTRRSCLCQPLTDRFGIFSWPFEKSKIHTVTHRAYYHFFHSLFGKRHFARKHALKLCLARMVTLDLISYHKVIYIIYLTKLLVYYIIIL